MNPTIYNASVKETFMQTVAVKSGYSATFKKFASYEAADQMDLCQMSRSRIVEILNAFQYPESQTYRNVISNIKTYWKWCAAQHLCDGTEDILSITVRKDIDFATILQQSCYVSFQDILSEFVDYDFDNGDIAAPSVCLVWLGVEPSKVRELKSGEVDLAAGTLTNPSNETTLITIPNEILSILQRYKATQTGVRIHRVAQTVSQFNTGYFIHKMLNSGDQADYTPVSRQHIAEMVAVVSDHYEKTTGHASKLSLANVWRSGALYRVYLLEQEVPLSSLEFKQRVREAYNVGSGVSTADIVAQYQAYKKAFNLD